MSTVSATKSGPTSVSSVSNCHAGMEGGDIVGFWGKERLEKYNNNTVLYGGYYWTSFKYIIQIRYGTQLRVERSKVSQIEREN